MDSAVVVRQPPERGYWNPVTETMSRERLRGLQFDKLRASLAHARRGSPFWRSRIPDGISSLDEYLARMPILTREDILIAESTKPPYGEFASCDPRLAIRHHQTSGTSGKPPVRTFDTARDWAWAADMWCTGLYGMGVRAHDRAARRVVALHKEHPFGPRVQAMGTGQEVDPHHLAHLVVGDEQL